MDNKFYDINNISFCDRESFNNAILLLTMVKSEYYYIIGFSRAKGIVNIGFDFEIEYHKTITESISIEFNSSDEYIILRSEIQNASGDCIEIDSNKYIGTFFTVNNQIFYTIKIRKDDVFPLGKKELDKYILSSKKDIMDFLKKQYSFLEKNK